MFFQVGSKVYKSGKMERGALQEKLKKFRKEYSQEDIDMPLTENIENFAISDNGVKFEFLYDYVIPIPNREGTQKVLKLAVAKIKIIDLPRNNLYLIYSKAKIADSIRVRLSRILSGGDDFVENVNIPSSVLRDIVINDAVEVKYGWWDDIGTYARKGALKGNLLKSSHYDDFEQSGEPTLITFESQSAGRTVRITSKAIITFYGKNITQEEIENYINQMIISRLGI